MPNKVARIEQLLEVYQGLVEVSALINAISDSNELLPAVLEVARRVMKVEAASLFLVQPNGDLQLAIASGEPGTFSQSDLDEQKIMVPRGLGIAGWSIAHNQPLLIADAYADPRFYPEVDQQTGFHTRSILCTPLVCNGQEIGVLELLNPLERDAFDQSDLDALCAYGNLAATAIDKLRSIERRRHQDRIEQEIALASEIQASFLPQSLPAITNPQFAALYLPALNVGGDFYDVIETGPDEIHFVVGDVSGKGIPAALLMAQALNMLRLILKPGLSPEAAVARWNAMLCGHTIHGMFITALVGRVTPSTRHVQLCSAGHCHPLRIDAAGRCQQITVNGSPPLGLLPELPECSVSLDLAVGEWLVLYTDGLVESFNAAHQLLSTEGLTALLTGRFATASAVIDALRTGEALHRKDEPPHDDLTTLVFGFQ